MTKQQIEDRIIQLQSEIEVLRRGLSRTDGVAETPVLTELQAWYRGINPYPRLTMDESFALIILMDGRSLTDDELETSQRLQRKSCAMAEAPRCRCCEETDNLAEVTATPTPTGTYLLCPRCLADEEQQS